MAAIRSKGNKETTEIGLVSFAHMESMAGVGTSRCPANPISYSAACASPCLWTAFLAWVPLALPNASKQPAILAKTRFHETAERDRATTRLIETLDGWLGASILAASLEGFGFCRAQKIKSELSTGSRIGARLAAHNYERQNRKNHLRNFSQDRPDAPSGWSGPVGVSHSPTILTTTSGRCIATTLETRASL